MAANPTFHSRWETVRTDGSNFDFLRLFAAGLVIISHSFEIVGGAGDAEPLRLITGDTSLGRLGVMIFFVLSGFLLAKSWREDPDLVRFGTKRFLRLAPALTLVVAISILFLGPIVSTVPASEYFRDRATLKYGANLLLYTAFDDLPGVFEGLPYPSVVNGPLWTLKFEVMCYLTLACFGFARLLKPRAIAIFCACAFFAAQLYPSENYAGANYYAHHYVDLAACFFSGSFFAVIAHRIPISPLLMATAAIALSTAALLQGFQFAFPLAGGYLVLAIAFSRLGRLRMAGKFGDFSYGLYLWGWPTQQLMISAFPASNWVVNTALSLPIALMAAAISWHLIEKPALSLKPARSGARGLAMPEIRHVLKRGATPRRLKIQP